MPDTHNEISASPGWPGRLLPATPMGWAMLGGMAVWFTNWVLGADAGTGPLGLSWLKWMLDILSGLGLIPLAWFAWRATQWIMRNLFWRLRQRLILTYFLIGGLPLALLMTMVAIIGYVIFLQSATSLVTRQYDAYIAHSRAAVEALVSDLNSGDLSRHDTAQLRHELQQRVNNFAAIFPGLRLTLSRGKERPLQLAADNDGNDAEGNDAAKPSLPAWLGARADFHGLVIERNAAGKHVHKVRHIIRNPAPGNSLIEVSYPLGTEIAARISQTTGTTIIPAPGVLAMARNGAENPDIAFNLEQDASGRPGIGVSASQPVLMVINEQDTVDGYQILMPARLWDRGLLLDSSVAVMDRRTLRPVAIFQRIREYRSTGAVESAVFIVVSGLALFFLLLAGLAGVSAVFLTRSITWSVHELYQGTRRIKAGDLEHEIPLRSHDQLSDLAESFNQMTRSIRELLRVSAEKQRLDQEMKIAAEVQSRLFPRQVPQLPTWDIAEGICLPARAVSGDYFDFLEIAPGVVGLVVADVCGKGMSAALLMSNLQASLRGQAQAYHDSYQRDRRDTAEGAGSARHQVNQIVGRVNRQIESSMTDSRFVTMFYAELDESDGVLRYTNAGHNAPLLLRAGVSPPQIEKLEAGGTVLGLFPDSLYDQGEVVMRAGDTLVACTDGLLEAHNGREEEFGEERLSLILSQYAHLSAREIEAEILRAIGDWTGGADQEDDLTLVVVKKRPVAA
ncbi:MAG: PP2C family protein-serine/threonine phosphatase [Blastocatellia bacterium]